MADMLPDIVCVFFSVLFEINRRGNFGNENGQNIGIFRQNIKNIFTLKKFCQFNIQSFRGYVFEKFFVSVNRSFCVSFNFKAQDGGETQSPHNTQSVLAKTGVRIPHGFYYTIIYVVQTAVQVHKPRFLVIGEGVHGKIPACKVLRKIACKGYVFGVSVVGIFAVNSECCDLVGRFVNYNRKSSVPEPRVNGFKVRKYTFHFFGQSGGGNIPIPRG